jgi:HK97 family phage prohead protease
LFVRAAPYSEEFTDIGGGVSERFLRGAFAKAANAPQRISLFYDHGGPLVGRGTEVDHRADGVYVRFKIGRTDAAGEMRSLIEDQILTDVSVEFRPIAEAMKVERDGDRLRVTHSRAILSGVAVVPEGAYGEQAKVLSMRDLEREREREQARLWFAEFKARGL